MLSTVTLWAAANLSHHSKKKKNKVREKEREPWYQVTSLIRHRKVENQTSTCKSAKCNEVDRCYLLWSVWLALRREVEHALKQSGLGLECLCSGQAAFV